MIYDRKDTYLVFNSEFIFRYVGKFNNYLHLTIINKMI